MGEVLGKFRGQGRDGQKKRSISQMFTQLEEITYFNRSEIKKWYKLFLKDCPDGHLKEERFVAFYTGSFQSGDLERKECLAKQIFRTFDRDGSGTVDFKEFMCGMSALLRGTTPERLKWAFNMYDLDGNGEISMQELLHVLKAAGTQGLAPVVWVTPGRVGLSGKVNWLLSCNPPATRQSLTATSVAINVIQGQVLPGVTIIHTGFK
ncbi:hypothetical protein Bbelb_356630 [Branchiostoma belcheri]|nr:hypothetical protein Bbelb_356630 [Branchiostoma belcheri]